MPETHSIGAAGKKLDLSAVDQWLKSTEHLVLSRDSRDRITACREYLQERLDRHDAKFYGINTGFGYLQDREIAYEDQAQLQINLIRSHACGTGSEVPPEMVRLMLLLKVKSLSFGHSGVQVETVERLLDFYNHDILPVIYTMGSLGASGDLAPLAHLALPLIGEGEVIFKGERMPSLDMLARMGWQPIDLKAKEGLALLNGTQFMQAYGVHCLLEGKRLLDLANQIAALSLDGFDAKMEPFHHLLHEIRPHNGQIQTARQIRDLLSDSQIAQRAKVQVQDPYSFRCIPQVHGASADSIDYVASVFETELNSVSDNPNIFFEAGEILSGGNFHGQPLAVTLDFLAIALAELASISERRSYQLLSGSRGLPLFLIANPGLDSGLMIPQYTAASMVSQNKQLCTPASVDTIPSSNNQEDHVSMGANAATKCLKVLDNLRRVLAIELLCAAQALEFRKPLQTGTRLIPLLESFRREVPFVDRDRELYLDISKTEEFLKTYTGR